MAQQIWDEGRVVGLSAYELYVREYLTQNPNGTPLSQSQWLANTILSGNSLLVRVKTNSLSNKHLIYNIQLPSDCPLYAANTIVGSFFIGKGHYASGSNIADMVESYGPLLPNVTETPADYDNTSITRLEELPGDYSPYQIKLNQYLSIADGIIIQPGEWTETTPTGTTPNYVLSNPSGKPILRLYLPNNGNVEFDFEILLTGFTDDSLVTSYQAPMPTNLPTADPLSGDFLGPAIRPWANKVIFSIPTWAISNLKDQAPKLTVSNQYQAGLSTGGSVKALALTNNQGTPYELNPSAGAQGTVDVQFTGDASEQTATLTWSMLLDSLVQGKPIKFKINVGGQSGNLISFTLNSNFYQMLNAVVPSDLTYYTQFQNFLSNINSFNPTYIISDTLTNHVVDVGGSLNAVSPYSSQVILPMDANFNLRVNQITAGSGNTSGYQLKYSVDNNAANYLNANTTGATEASNVSVNSSLTADVIPPKLICIFKEPAPIGHDYDDDGVNSTYSLGVRFTTDYAQTIGFSQIPNNGTCEIIVSSRSNNYVYDTNEMQITLNRNSISTGYGYYINVCGYSVDNTGTWKLKQTAQPTFTGTNVSEGVSGAAMFNTDIILIRIHHPSVM